MVGIQPPENYPDNYETPSVQLVCITMNIYMLMNG